MDRLSELAKKIDIELNDHQLEQFQRYYELLVEWNKVMNLTAITEKEDVIIKHFADSLLLAKYTKLDESLSVIDVGTGAGFPGIPLKIAFPGLKVTLMDSLNKRVKFLNEVIRTLEMDDIEAIHSRAEDGGRNAQYREKYDLAVSRAVANLSSLSEFCMLRQVDILFHIRHPDWMKRSMQEKRRFVSLEDRWRISSIQRSRIQIWSVALYL